MIWPHAWEDPPTRRQLDYLRSLGVKGQPENKGQAWNWIARELGEPEHDHSKTAREYLLCCDCGERGFEGVPEETFCPSCGGGITIGTGWVCCFERYDPAEDEIEP